MQFHFFLVERLKAENKLEMGRSG